MIGELLTLIGGGVLVIFAAILFTNAIEYLGYKMNWSRSFVGAVLAPLFTSFPELVVFLVAVFIYGGEAGEAIGIGTLYGQPFMASSLSYGLVGFIAIIGYYMKKRSDLVFEVERELIIPYTFITILFPLTLFPAIFPSIYTRVIGSMIFLGSYVGYIYLMYSKRITLIEEEVEKPYLDRFINNDMVSTALQLAISVIMLYYGSEVLVSAVDSLASLMGITPLAMSLIAIPAVTALPETASALVWGYRGRDTLSIASLVGEKILYSTFYPGIGIILTSWTYDFHAALSVIATTVISLILLYYIYKRRIPWYGLMIGFVFFILYAYIVFWLHR